MGCGATGRAGELLLWDLADLSRENDKTADEDEDCVVSHLHLVHCDDPTRAQRAWARGTFYSDQEDRGVGQRGRGFKDGDWGGLRADQVGRGGGGD